MPSVWRVGLAGLALNPCREPLTVDQLPVDKDRYRVATQRARDGPITTQNSLSQRFRISFAIDCDVLCIQMKHSVAHLAGGLYPSPCTVG